MADLTTHTGIFAARDIKFLVQKQGDEESSEEDEMDEKAGPVTPIPVQCNDLAALVQGSATTASSDTKRNKRILASASMPQVLMSIFLPGFSLDVI